MTFLVALNPSANGGRARSLKASLERSFDRSGLEAEWLEADSAEGVREALARKDLSPYQGVVAAGGDGTVFQVLNGLCVHEPAARPPLGILPVGTGNAFARDLGLAPGDWSAGMALLAGGSTRAVDLAEARCADATFWFINIIGLGFVVEAGQWATRLKRLGRAAYTLGALAAMVRLKTHDLVLTLDGERFALSGPFVELSNSRYTGTHFLIAPDARLDDGLLDLTGVSRVSRRRLVKLFPTIYDGSHVELEEVVTRQAARVTIEAPQGLPLMADGEFIGHTPVDIRCHPGALRVFSSPP